MKKRKLFYLGTVLILLLGLFVPSLSSTIFAKEVSLIGTDHPTVTTDSGQSVGPNQSTNRYKYYKVSYDWSVPKGETIEARDTATFPLPKNIQILNDTTFDVTTKDGKVIGKFTIKKGASSGVLTFNDYISKHHLQNVKGTLEFWGNGIQGSSYEYQEINKVSWVDDNGKPTWYILYNPNSEKRTNVTITDQLSGPQKLDKDSIEIQFGTVANGKFIADSPQPKVEYTIVKREDGFTLKIPKLNRAVQVIYHSTPTKAGDLNLSNKVQGKSDQLGVKQNSSSIQVGGSGNASGDKPIESSTSEISSSEKESSSSDSMTSSENTMTSNSDESQSGIETTDSSIQDTISRSEEDTIESTKETSIQPIPSTTSTEDSEDSIIKPTTSSDFSTDMVEDTSSTNEGTKVTTSISTDSKRKSDSNDEDFVGKGSETDSFVNEESSTSLCSTEEETLINTYSSQKAKIIPKSNHPSEDNSNSNDDLPQTGAKGKKYLMLIGTMLVSLVTIFGIFCAQKEKE